jgi:site-specific recombinase XerD
VNVAQQALKQFFRLTVPRDWKTLQLARVKVDQKIPVVLSVGEVHTFLKLIEKPAMHCFFSVVYTLGLRLQEALHLQVPDIDSKRMLVHIHRGKGAKDRLVPLCNPSSRSGRQLETHSEVSRACAPDLDHDLPAYHHRW